MSNTAYFYAGSVLIVDDDRLLGGLTVLAGLVSWRYHFEQLAFPEGGAAEVEVALVADYAVASSIVLVASFYALEVNLDKLPPLAYIYTLTAVFFVLVGWFPPYGLPRFRLKDTEGGQGDDEGAPAGYIFFHSLWHLFSSLAIFQVGEAHLAHVLSEEHAAALIFLQ